jgi:hypothetical protein
MAAEQFSRLLTSLEGEYQQSAYNLMSLSQSIARTYFAIAKSFYVEGSDKKMGDINLNKSIFYFSAYQNYAAHTPLENEELAVLRNINLHRLSMLKLSERRPGALPLPMAGGVTKQIKEAMELEALLAANDAQENVESSPSILLTSTFGASKPLPSLRIIDEEGSNEDIPDCAVDVLPHSRMVHGKEKSDNQPQPTLTAALNAIIEQEERIFSHVTKFSYSEAHEHSVGVQECERKFEQLEDSFIQSTYKVSLVYIIAAKEHLKNPQLANRYFEKSIALLELCAHSRRNSKEERFAYLKKIESVYKLIIFTKCDSESASSVPIHPAIPSLDLQAILPFGKLAKLLKDDRDLQQDQDLQMNLIKGYNVGKQLLSLIESAPTLSSHRYDVCNDTFQFARLHNELHVKKKILLEGLLRSCLQLHPAVDSDDYTEKSNFIYNDAVERERKGSRSRSTSRGPQSESSLRDRSQTPLRTSKQRSYRRTNLTTSNSPVASRKRTYTQ